MRVFNHSVIPTVIIYKTEQSFIVLYLNFMLNYIFDNKLETKIGGNL